jgi:hypothetical protein
MLSSRFFPLLTFAEGVPMKQSKVVFLELPGSSSAIAKSLTEETRVAELFPDHVVQADSVVVLLRRPGAPGAPVPPPTVLELGDVLRETVNHLDALVVLGPRTKPRVLLAAPETVNVTIMAKMGETTRAFALPVPLVAPMEDVHARLREAFGIYYIDALVRSAFAAANSCLATRSPGRLCSPARGREHEEDDRAKGLRRRVLGGNASGRGDGGDDAAK